MSVTAIVVGLIVVVAIVAIAAWYFTQQRRRAELRQQFGPEYDHAVERYGERGRAEDAFPEFNEAPCLRPGNPDTHMPLA